MLDRRRSGRRPTLYSGVLVEAYQAANVKVQVSDMRAAVERHNDDGSVDVLVAVRVKVTNSEAADQEQGYRLRVTMAPDDGNVQDRQARTGHVVTAVLDATPNAPADDASPTRAAGVLAGPRGRLLPGRAARRRA